MNNNSFAPSFGTSALGTTSSTDTTAAIKSMAGLLPTEPQTPKRSTSPKSSPTGDGTEGSKRRGPNSHRVRNMFDSITESRVLLDDVISKHNVSVHVARQSKRFDPFAERGQVMIKTLTDDSTGNKKTYIWRVPNPS